jgi:hypothetical protein
MTLVNFVTQLWVILLSLVLMVAVLAVAIAIRMSWKHRQERPLEVDPEYRRRLDQRLLEISTPQRKTA